MKTAITAADESWSRVLFEYKENKYAHFFSDADLREHFCRDRDSGDRFVYRITTEPAGRDSSIHTKNDPCAQTVTAFCLRNANMAPPCGEKDLTVNLMLYVIPLHPAASY
ncbi:hypothetical protein ACFSQ7_34430 [Paenibacillus rhizoplanae]